MPEAAVVPFSSWELLAVDATKILVFFGIILTVFAMTTLAERRLLAFMQFRLGPNRVGPFGLLQPAADGIKLFFKEEHMPEGANVWLFTLAPAIAIVTAFLAIAVIPYGPPVHFRGHEIPLQIVDLDVGVLYIFAIAALGVYGIVMAGWASNNKFALLGGLRSSAQMFSYELSLGLSWVGVIMLAGSFRLSDIVAAQAGGFWHWNMVLQLPAFIIYAIAATAETNRTPVRSARGRDRARGRFPHRVLVDEVRPHPDGRVREHLHRLRPRDEPLHGGLARSVPLSRFGGGDSPGAPVVLRQVLLRGLLPDLAPGHRAPRALRPAHAFRLEGAGAGGRSRILVTAGIVTWFNR